MGAKDKIIIFDTTLRDGEQSPGFSMNIRGKTPLRGPAGNLGVDVIEAGFPGHLRRRLRGGAEDRGAGEEAQVAGLARANFKDIEAAWEALKDAEKPRIHTFISSSDIHIKHQFKKTREEVLEHGHRRGEEGQVLHGERGVLAHGRHPERPGYPGEMVQAVIEAGATTVNIPDTVGYTIPSEFHAHHQLSLRERGRASTGAIISVHCHNDLGLAVANSLAAIEAGARQVECTVNGIGERAGNTSMEEIVMAIKTRSDIFNVHTGINTKQIMATSKLLTHITGVTGAAQQGHRGRQRLRARVRHPPGRRAEERHDLRDHEARGRGHQQVHRWCWASTRGAMPSSTG